MKQLVVTPSFPYSSHTFVTREVASTLHAGHDVWILSPTDGDATGEEFRCIQNFPMERVIYTNYESCSPFDVSMTRLRSSICSAADANYYGRLLAERRKTFFAKLLKDKRLQNVELIHAHFLSWGYRVGVPLAQLLGVPITVTVHEVELPDMPKHILQHVQERADIITIVSSKYLRHYENMTGSKDRLRVLHNGTDLSEFPPSFRGSSSRVRVVTVSRLVPHKRVSDGIKAIGQLIGQGFDVEYTIVSDGPERNTLEELTATLGLSDRIRFCGYLPRSELVRELVNGDILLHPSEAEGFGVAVIEGMAASLPVVVARSGGVQDIVEHGRFGYLYDPGNIEELVSYLKDLLINKGKCKEFGAEARCVAQARFSWEGHMDQMYQVWSDALGAHAHRLTNTKGSR